MKKIFIQTVTTAIFLTCSVTAVRAVPLGSSNDAMSYLFKDPVLTRLSAGMYGGQFKSEITPEGSHFPEVLTSKRFIGYLGISPLRWLNVYALGGQNTTKLEGGAYADGEFAYGGGFSVNLLNHFFREPIPMEDAFRLNFGAQYLTTESMCFGFEPVEWDEISAALTISIINHTTGSKYYSPESIALYFGPAICALQSDAFDAKNDVGGVIGLEIFITDSCSLDLKAEYYAETSMSAGVNLHF